MTFVHLRVHSAYSIAQGAIRMADLISHCQKQQMPAIAVTDTNNCFGAREFSIKAPSAGIQPILGAELLVAVSKEQNQLMSHDIERVPMVVLVQNQAGWWSLCHLLKIAYMDRSEHSLPHITFDDLLQNHQGLILLSGGAGGILGHMLLKGKTAQAEDMLNSLHGVYQDRFYMELTRHGLWQEEQTEAQFLSWALQYNIPLVATNDAYFLEKSAHTAQDALMCISEKSTISQNDRKKLTDQHYLRSPAEMEELFSDLPEATANTLHIAQRCSFLVEAQPPELPHYVSDAGRSETEELKYLSEQGLQRRLTEQVYQDAMGDKEKEQITKQYFDRLYYELKVIEQMGFPGYFLIVADFIRKAKEMGVAVGPGRGSGAGSLVAWSLTITDIDPIPFNLLFERFLNPERVSMPDFDIDFCQSRREEVITYVQEKYGVDKVAQIITFGKLQAKAAIRDVGRVLELPRRLVDSIAKHIPADDLKITIQKAIDTSPEFKEAVYQDENTQQLKDVAMQLEGLYRNSSTHAAGVVIGARALEKIVPLYKDPRSPMPVTGFDMGYIEDTGLIKFDFLGLKTLTVLEQTIANIQQTENIEINLSKIPLKDQKTFDLLATGATTGIFQLESVGMQKVIKGVRPDCLEDLIAVVSLYRPGPMDNIPAYQDRKAGREQPEYLHPMLEPILSETYGIMVYQEQVMQIAQTMAGYSLGGADLLRRAMGKKKKEEMDKQRETFITGARENHIDTNTAEAVFDQMAKFASYGFNKSHAAAYALIAWQTAYLKAHYMPEFLAANMTLDQDITDKLNIFVQDAKDHQIEILPPDVNKSYSSFKVEHTDGGKAIRYSLAALKGVGASFIDALTKERDQNGPFKDIHDFANRVDSGYMNKKILEALAKAGAFDRLLNNRRLIMESCEDILRHIQVMSKERSSSQQSLFGDFAGVSLDNQVRLKQVDDWNKLDRLSEEIESVGFYLTGHPLDVWKKQLERFGTKSILELKELQHAGRFSIAGVLLKVRKIMTKRGNMMAIITLSDATGILETAIFGDQFEEYKDLLNEGELLYVRIHARERDGEMGMEARIIRKLEDMVNLHCKTLVISAESYTPFPQLKEHLDLLDEGNVQVILQMHHESTTFDIDLMSRHINIDGRKLEDIKNISGIVNIEQLFGDDYRV